MFTELHNQDIKMLQAQAGNLAKIIAEMEEKQDQFVEDIRVQLGFATTEITRNQLRAYGLGTASDVFEEFRQGVEKFQRNAIAAGLLRGPMPARKESPMDKAGKAFVGSEDELNKARNKLAQINLLIAQRTEAVSSSIVDEAEQQQPSFK